MVRVYFFGFGKRECWIIVRLAERFEGYAKLRFGEQTDRLSRLVEVREDLRYSIAKALKFDLHFSGSLDH